MPHLASVADVRRIMQIPSASVDADRDAQMRAALNAVEALAANFPWTTPPAGPNIETYFDISEDATLPLPAADVVVTEVKVFEYPSANGIPISPVQLGLGHGYDITANGQLILRPVLVVSPFSGAVAQRRLRQYSRVEVFYIGSGIIPTNITEGIAYLAAGWWKDGPRALEGLTSERIGDYAYTLNGDDQNGLPSYIERGMWMLRPSFKRMRVIVT